MRVAERSLAVRSDALRRQAQALRNLDPRRVLERGYALLQSAQGHALASTQELAEGQAIVAVLHDGRADLQVERVEVTEAAAGTGPGTAYSPGTPLAP